MAMTTAHGGTRTRFLTRPGGRVAYDVEGTGPLVVCVPGMGDVRAVYRHLTAQLVREGFQVATVDLRGHGESDTGFSSYGDEATAGDLLALVGELGGPALLVGNSMGAAAAVRAAADEPGSVAGLVLIGPFVRDVPLPRLRRLALRVALWRPWGPAVWASYYASKLYPARRPADLATHVAAIRAAQARPGAWSAFVATARTSRAGTEPRLGEVAAPALVVMGDADPDFPSPVEEAELVAGRLGGEILVVPGAGHYPQAELPEVVGPRVAAFARRVTGRA